MLFPKGLKCKIALPDGVHVLSKGVSHTDFLHSRGVPKAEVFDRRDWFLNVIAWPLYNNYSETCNLIGQ
jgi:hypothetical protein